MQATKDWGKDYDRGLMVRGGCLVWTRGTLPTMHHHTVYIYVSELGVVTTKSSIWSYGFLFKSPLGKLGHTEK